MMGDDQKLLRKISSEDDVLKKKTEAVQEEEDTDYIEMVELPATDKPKPAYLGTPKTRHKPPAPEVRLPDLDKKQRQRQQLEEQANGGSKIFDTYKAHIMERAAGNESVADMLPPVNKDLLSVTAGDRRFTRRRSWNGVPAMTFRCDRDRSSATRRDVVSPFTVTCSWPRSRRARPPKSSMPMNS